MLPEVDVRRRGEVVTYVICDSIGDGWELGAVLGRLAKATAVTAQATMLTSASSPSGDLIALRDMLGDVDAYLDGCMSHDQRQGDRAR
jgi:hypothetical protein